MGQESKEGELGKYKYKKIQIEIQSHTNTNTDLHLTKWDRKAKKVRWAKLVPVCWLIQGLLSATLRKYNITEIRFFWPV